MPGIGVPRGPPPLPVPCPPVQWSSSPQRLLLLPSRGRVPQLHTCTHVRHRTGLWPRWDHGSTQGWPRTPTKQALISACPQVPRPQRTGPTPWWPQQPLAWRWQEAEVSSVCPHLPPEHRPKGAEPLLSPGLPSPRPPRSRCQSSAGGTAPVAARGQEHHRVCGERWQEGTRGAPPDLSHCPRAGPSHRRAAHPSQPQENPGFIKTQFIPNVKRLQFSSSLQQLINQNTLHFLLKKFNLF